MFALVGRLVAFVVDVVSLTGVLARFAVVVLNWRFLPGLAVLLYQRYLGRVLFLGEWRMESLVLVWVA